MEKMLVTKGLNELKLLNDRITKEIRDAKFVCYKKKSTDSINSNTTATEYSEKALSQYHSIIDLIERRRKIKSAIILSNATTKVTVHGEEMTVAEAIEQKKAFTYEKSLYSALNYQYTLSDTAVQRENERVDANAVKLLETAYGKDKTKIDADAYKNVVTPYKNANEYEIVDPLNALEESKNLQDYVDGFLSEVDTVLQVSNSTTVIEF